MSILVAVATDAEGFRTMTELAPGLAFHALVSVGGTALIGRANRIALERSTLAVAPTQG